MLRSGNRGVWFTIDALFAIVLVIMVFALYNKPIENNTLFDPSINDAFVVLNYDEVLDTLNATIVKEELAILTPKYYYKINYECDSAGFLTDLTDISNEKPVISSDFIISTDEDNCIIKYWTWLK